MEDVGGKGDSLRDFLIDQTCKIPPPPFPHYTSNAITSVHTVNMFLFSPPLWNVYSCCKSAAVTVFRWAFSPFFLSLSQ